MAGVIPKREFNEQIKRAVRYVLRQQRTSTINPARWQTRGTGEQRILGFLATTIAANDDPRNTWGGTPTGILDKWTVQDDGSLAITDPLEQETIFNRTDIAFAEDTYMECVQRDGKWQPDVANCGTTAGIP